MPVKPPAFMQLGEADVRVEVASDSDPRFCCEQLEVGRILYFPLSPFTISATDREFLLRQQQSDSSLHKNISYRPHEDVLRGFATQQADDIDRLHAILRDYSRQATSLLTRLLAPYAGSWSLDFASYRPIEEATRNLPLHKRNDLLHVDAFPTRPTRGGRILRCFTNINPQLSRVWQTTLDFSAVAAHWAGPAGLHRIAREQGSFSSRLGKGFADLKRALGFRSPNYSAYDRCMLRLHDFLKESNSFQTQWPLVRLEFPPQSSWLVFTDSVPHAVLSGRCALEQTYIISEATMLLPDRSPRRVLESICGRSLLDDAPSAAVSRAA